MGRKKALGQVERKTAIELRHGSVAERPATRGVSAELLDESQRAAYPPRAGGLQ